MNDEELASAAPTAAEQDARSAESLGVPAPHASMGAGSLRRQITAVEWELEKTDAKLAKAHALREAAEVTALKRQHLLLKLRRGKLQELYDRHVGTTR